MKDRDPTRPNSLLEWIMFSFFMTLIAVVSLPFMIIGYIQEEILKRRKQ